MENPFEDAIIPLTSLAGGLGQEVARDVYCQSVQIVNVCFVGSPETGDWVIVDAGMPRSAEQIIGAAERRFGKHAPPQALILTHGHFDHVGAIVDLVEHWGIPVYAHTMELPYLTGQSDYPRGDAAVGGGLVSQLAPWFPNQAIDLGDHVKPLPADHSVPHLAEWRWLHTPGHTLGHISLFRERDGVLIAGDAVVTVKQESLFDEKIRFR